MSLGRLTRLHNEGHLGTLIRLYGMEIYILEYINWVRGSADGRVDLTIKFDCMKISKIHYKKTKSNCHKVYDKVFFHVQKLSE